ncbi:MAG: GTP 3',8-cyclase MoaA [Clostridia bacterium]|nr:GTP 3',8-cyclase MoaA [Clostridia bacterium]
MKDNLGREINYLRISVTQRCNFRCAYCSVGYPDENELSPAEIAVFARAFARAGIKKIRLTGGEPLVRDDITEIAFAVKEAASPEIIAVTTNGYLLEKKAQDLKKAGVGAVNISVDTLDRECFRRMTGKDALEAVTAGLEKALETGFERVKINTVLIRGVNDDGAERLLCLAKKYPVDVRFIELMPTESGGENKLVTSAELLSRFPFLCPSYERDGAAVYYRADGFRGRVGFISPVSKKFCGSCNRIRLLSNGAVKPCLGQNDVYDLRKLLPDEERLYSEICSVIQKKPAGHHFEDPSGKLSSMNKIGG